MHCINKLKGRHLFAVRRSKEGWKECVCEGQEEEGSTPLRA